MKFGTKLAKYLKIQIFEIFMHFLCTFRKTWWLRMLTMFKKERNKCRGGVFEEIKAIGVEKMHQIQSEIDKNKILKNLCSFGVLFEKHGGLEC